MEETTQILELFPTPLYIDTIPPGFEFILPFFDSQKMVGSKNEDKTIDSLNFGSRSLNTYILFEKECKDFADYILSLSYKFGKMLGYSYKEYVFSQSWLTWKYPGQQHSKHMHANSLLSGIFYYGRFDENTPSIEFHKPEVSNSLLISPSQEPNPEYSFSHSICKLKVNSGMILLFPSNLLHSVPFNNTSFVRKSLAFNIVPKEGFGIEGNLTELKFNY